jgi:hypothetical protein
MYVPGSASAEGYHRRLEEIMPNRALPADKIVEFLAGEDEYWNRIVNDDRQWQAKKSEHRSAQAQNQKRRRTITTYLANNKVFSANVSVDPFSSPASDKELLNTTSISDTSSITDADIVDLVNDDLDPMRPVSPTCSITPDVSPCPSPISVRKNQPSTRRIPVDPNKLCVKCKQRKANGSCTQRSCKTCCVELNLRCTLTDHVRGKVAARQPYGVNFGATSSTEAPMQATDTLETRIREIIAAKKHVFISYKGDKMCRNIQPHAIEEGREGLLVRAMDHTRNGERSFYIAKITRIEDVAWQVTTEQGKCNAPCA